MEAATLLAQGMKLMETKQIAEALKNFEKARTIDPQCSFALYWEATAAADLGEMDRAIASFKEIVERGRRSGIENVTVDSAINLGLTYGGLGDDEKATHYFSQAVLLDPKDKYKMAYKAYRNLAIAFNKRKQAFSAALCAINAYEANPKMVDPRMVEQMLEAIGSEEVGTPLNFPRSGDAPKPRKELAKIKPLAIVGVEEQIADLQVDPVQDRVFAFGGDLSHYYVFEGKSPERAAKVSVEGSIVSACANGGALYVMLKNPAALAKVEPATGKIEKRWPLKSTAASLAVYPIQNRAFFPVNGSMQTLDLQTSEVAATKFICSKVRVDPRQRFCYTYIHPGFRNDSGHMLVGGRPVFFQRSSADWAQTSLVRYAIADDELLLSSFRLNAASNGRVLHVSPDGRWVAVVGGGGWRPTGVEGKTGYGVAVFSADDFGNVQGFYATDAYPQGAAVNPVAGLVAAFNEKKVWVSDLASPAQRVELDGSFGNASTWDSGGQTLYAASKEKGLTAFQVDRSTEEIQIAKAWASEMKKNWPALAEAQRESTAKTVPGFSGFQPATSKEKVVQLIQSAIREGRTTKPIRDIDYAPYTSGATKRSDLEETFKLAAGSETGIAIFKLKKLLEADPKNPALKVLIGFAYFRTGQLDKATAAQLEAIHADEGRTAVTVEALRNLAHIHRQKKEAIPAAHCYAAVLLLDKANPKFAREAESFFEAAGVSAEAKPLLEASNGMVAPAEQDAPKGLPKLLAPEAGPIMDSVKLFAAMVPSVVLVKAPNSTGSGVCVAEGVLLTNQHVIAGAGGGLTIHPYFMSNGKLQRMNGRNARVIYADEKRDIALLAIENPPPSLKPLPLATSNPETGARVYAIGSPGLGKELLEQSITEGIVSAVERELEGLFFLQHTAAVNPGNSGGPLLNAQGHIVGINTTKPALENVSFAIPAPAIRKALESK